MPEGTCCADGCADEVHAKGRCKRHYTAWYRDQNPDKVAAYSRARKKKPESVGCVRCGAEFHRVRKDQVYCSIPCRRQGEKERARARGYSHPKETACCKNCGTTFERDRSGRPKVYCSPACHSEAKRWRYRKDFSCDVPWASCTECRRQFVRRTSRDRCESCVPNKKQHPRRWTAGECAECGGPFVSRWHPKWPCRFCSDSCRDRATKRDARHRRRAREKAQRDGFIYRRRVFVRDGWVCQLCGKPVDKDAVAPSHLAPTLDHIIPLSKNGRHSEDNCQLAHFICNARKSDGSSVAVGKQMAFV